MQRRKKKSDAQARAERRNSCRVTTTGDAPPEGSGLVALPRQKRALETKPVPAIRACEFGLWSPPRLSHVSHMQPLYLMAHPKTVAQQPQPAAQRLGKGLFTFGPKREPPHPTFSDEHHNDGLSYPPTRLLKPLALEFLFFS